MTETLAPPPTFDARRLARGTVAVVFGNAAIAAFLTLGVGRDGWVNLLYSQAIGLGIYFSVTLLSMRHGGRAVTLFDVGLGIAGGGAAGYAVATWLNGGTLAAALAEPSESLALSAAAAVLFGVTGTYGFHGWRRRLDAEAAAEAERLRRIEEEALRVRSELRLLQAQIEPHFLFNTLATTLGLIDQNPAAAKATLLDLTALLRSALARTRTELTTLGEEFELLRAYLGIMERRMGERLRWRLDAPPALLALRLPPLLLQPLVENAIRHGLETRPAGGRVAVTASRQGAGVRLRVEDDGSGMVAGGEGVGGEGVGGEGVGGEGVGGGGGGVGGGGGGVGLSNVRARLAARYGDAATLSFAGRDGGGTVVELVLPGEA